MKHKVSELTGNQLDAAVATAQGWKRARVYDRFGKPWGHDAWCEDGDTRRSMHNAEGPHAYTPSANWADGGPIIEREHIKLAPFSETYWEAVVYDFKTEPDRWPGRGPTPLIAAMRAYVASKFGEEVDLP